ncbi:MAG TPA: polyphosphate kinase, partial [Solirubrobacteraceae bacterium]
MTAPPDTDTQLQESISASEPVLAAPEPEDLDLHDTSLYFGRELSWLDFNDRVLQLVEDPDQPLLERVKLAAIWSSNLDEFFQIRVAGVHDQIDAGLVDPGPDGLTPSQTIDAIRERVLAQQGRVQDVVGGTLFPALAEHGIRIVGMDEVSDADREALAERFRRQIFPVLTPLAVGHGRPFPYISSLSLSLAVLVRDPVVDEQTFARVKVPTEMLPRFVALDDDPLTFVALEEVIAANLEALFPGMEIVEHGFFRVTRDADFEVSDEADDLLQAVEAELRRRRFGEAVRLEVGVDIDAGVRQQLTEALDLEERQVYVVDGLLDLGHLWQIYGLRGFTELRDPPWTPVTQPRLQGKESEHVNVMAEMRRGDILVHHPYDSFATSVERFVEQAVADPDVLAIKQTVYRTSDDSPLVPALIRATERGKQAVCMVELKARFDERANITW